MTDSLNLTYISVRVWVASQITLLVDPQFQRLVAHIVSEINCLLPFASWYYCPSSDDPADLLTRGLTFKQFHSSRMWLHEPPWLLNQQQGPVWEQEPISHLHAVVATLEESIPDQRTPSDVGLHLIISVVRFSTLTKLLRVTVCVHRFIQALCNH